MLAHLHALSTKELSILMHRDESSIRRRAATEGWISNGRAKKLGGPQWLIDRMPRKTQKQIHTAVLTEKLADDFGKHPTPPVNTRQSRNISLNGLPETRQRQVEAKAFIVTLVNQIIKESGRAPTEVMFEFSHAYKKDLANVPDWVKDAIPTIGRSAIRNWRTRMTKEGLRSLAKRHEKRPPRNIIQQYPELETFVLGMIEEFPHISGASLFNAIKARFGQSGKAADLNIPAPSKRRVQAWLSIWKEKHEQIYAQILNPDNARSAHKAAFGNASAHIDRMNQEWQADSTLCDLMLNDGRRHVIVSIIDVFTRRVRFHVSRTSSAAAVASCLRKALLEWGVPEYLKTDNGADYTSQHIERVVGKLGIIQHVCPPFTPEAKPHVERAFKTFLHSFVELMPGFIGHNVAERKGIEARKSFADRLFKKMKTENEFIKLAVSPEELQDICDKWSTAVYGNAPHSGLDGRTPNAVAAAYNGQIDRIEDERALDMLLLPSPGAHGTRVIGKKGLRISSDVHGLKIKGHYFSADIAPLIGQRVLVRMDDADLGRVYCFDMVNNEYLGKAENPDYLGWSPDDVRRMAIAAVQQQKDVLADQRKTMKTAAKQADVKDIAKEILNAAISRHASITQQPAYEAVPYTNPALQQAARAIAGDFAAPTDEECNAIMTGIEIATFSPPTEDGQCMDLWLRLFDRLQQGETVTDEELTWMDGYRTHNAICRTYLVSSGTDPDVPLVPEKRAASAKAAQPTHEA